jgi:hypothetical protein
MGGCIRNVGMIRKAAVTSKLIAVAGVAKLEIVRAQHIVLLKMKSYLGIGSLLPSTELKSPISLH